MKLKQPSRGCVLDHPSEGDRDCDCDGDGEHAENARDTRTTTYANANVMCAAPVGKPLLSKSPRPCESRHLRERVMYRASPLRMQLLPGTGTGTSTVRANAAESSRSDWRRDDEDHPPPRVVYVSSDPVHGESAVTADAARVSLDVAATNISGDSDSDSDVHADACVYVLRPLFRGRGLWRWRWQRDRHLAYSVHIDHSRVGRTRVVPAFTSAKSAHEWAETDSRTDVPVEPEGVLLNDFLRDYVVGAGFVAPLLTCSHHGAYYEWRALVVFQRHLREGEGARAAGRLEFTYKHSPSFADLEVAGLAAPLRNDAAHEDADAYDARTRRASGGGAAVAIAQVFLASAATAYCVGCEPRWAASLLTAGVLVFQLFAAVFLMFVTLPIVFGAMLLYGAARRT